MSSGFLNTHLEVDVTELATTLDLPTLVVHGRDDFAIPLEHGHIMATLIPRAKFEIEVRDR